MSLPPGPVTVIKPVVAPAGTVAVSWFWLLNVTAASTPLNCTVEDALKLKPEMTTDEPVAPSVGLNVVMTVGLFGAVPVSTTFFK